MRTLELTLMKHSEKGAEVLDSWLLVPLSCEEVEVVLQSEITRSVTAALWRKHLDGVREHGFPMQPGDGVDALQNSLEEALDLAQYLMKAIKEK